MLVVAAGTFTPLFQIIFFPDLTQVNFTPLTVETFPTFGHLAPALAVAAVAEVLPIARTNTEMVVATRISERFN
jgi:hypothetical protein